MWPHRGLHRPGLLDERGNWSHGGAHGLHQLHTSFSPKTLADVEIQTIGLYRTILYIELYIEL